jgi:hypothetical protein
MACHGGYRAAANQIGYATRTYKQGLFSQHFGSIDELAG